jgi:hypothetical protein
VAEVLDESWTRSSGRRSADRTIGPSVTVAVRAGCVRRASVTLP